MRLLTWALVLGGAYWAYTKYAGTVTGTSTAAPAGTSLTLVPVPKNANVVFSTGGNTLLLDTSGNYYLQQGNTPYALPITAANAESLIATYA